MEAKIYTYTSKDSFTRKHSYKYMGNSDQLFAEIKKGTTFAVVPGGGVYSIYSIEGNKHTLLFDCNKRDRDLILKNSKPVIYSGSNEEYIKKLKFHVNNILNDIENKVRSVFYKKEDSMPFNRSLMKTNQKLYEEMRELSSGKISKAYRDTVAIMAETQPISEFKKFLRTVKDKLKSKWERVNDYERRYHEYKSVFRYVESSVASSIIRTLGDSAAQYKDYAQINGGFSVRSIKFFGNGISFSNDGLTINVITRDDENFDVYELKGDKVKCISTSASLDETMEKVRSRYVPSI